MTRVEQNKINGSKGGRKAAKTMSKEAKELRSSKAGSACLKTYGSSFFRFIRLKGIRKQRRSRGANS